LRVYHDWEFLEDGVTNTVKPISVGMVTEDGDELYYEFVDAPWNDILKHSWLPHNVLPALHKGWNTAIVTGEGNRVMASTLYIRTKVHDFLAKASIKGPLSLWGWYSSYDHVCLGQLFGSMVDLPSIVPMWTNDIRQEAHRLGEVRIPDMRRGSEKPHNALDDARAEARMHQWLMAYENGLNAEIRYNNTF
jgi:hypothetical protein